MWRSALIVGIVVLGLLVVVLLAQRLGLGPAAASQIALAAGALALMSGPFFFGRFRGHRTTLFRYALIWTAIIAGVALLYWAGNRLLPPSLRLDHRTNDAPVYSGPTQEV